MADDNNLTTLAKRLGPLIKMASEQATVGVDHGRLSGLSDDDHPQYVHSSIARSISAQHDFSPAIARAPFSLGTNAQGQLVTGLRADELNKSVLVSGLGLSGGGLLTADRTITVSSSSDPGAAASLLASDASGFLSLVRLKTDTLADKSGANLTIAPTGDITLDPGGNDILPLTNYDLNLGAINKKFLALHAAELWVETLVAQNTLATIGGRILVAPTTTLVDNLSSTWTNLLGALNPGFETAGGGGDDVFANWAENWSDGGIYRDGTTKHSGSYSCKIVAGPTVWYQTNVLQWVGVAANQGYAIEFWSRGDGSAVGGIEIDDVSNGGQIVPYTSTGNSSTTWHKMTAHFTTPPGCVIIQVVFWAGQGPTGSTAWYDDVNLYQSIIKVKHPVLNYPDIIYLEANGQVEWIKVMSGYWMEGDKYCHLVVRDLDETGPNDWYAGDAVLNTGTTGDGFIDIYSLRSMRSASHIGPTICGNVHSGPTYSEITECWAIGNLNGLYGYGVDTYGVGLGRYGANLPNIVIDGTNGMRIRNYNTDVMHFDTSGTAEITGTMAVTGTLTAGAGSVILDSTGIRLKKGFSGYLRIEDDGGTYNNMSISSWNNTMVLQSKVAGYGFTFYIKTTDTLSPYITWKESTANKTQLFVGGGANGGQIVINSAFMIDTNGTGASAEADIRAEGGIAIGDGAFYVDPGPGVAYIKAGLQVGDLYLTAPTGGQIQYTGNLTPYRNSTFYTGYVFVPILTGLTSTSWDGDSYSTTARTLIDLSAVFGLPAGIKAVAIRLACRDSGSATSTNLAFLVSPNNTDPNTPVCARPCGVIADAFADQSGICPCNADGDIYYQINASGASTMDCWIHIYGYFI